MAIQKQDSTEELLIAAPVIALQDIGGVFWSFLREVGSMFWFIVHTFEETIERLRDGRVPFRAISFVRDALLIRDIVTGVFKSFMFGLLIAAIACYRGLTVKGGAAGVGTATTSSVVTAITVVIGVDTLYNIVYVVFFPT